jgi:hypothetical protein
MTVSRRYVLGASLLAASVMVPSAIMAKPMIRKAKSSPYASSQVSFLVQSPSPIVVDASVYVDQSQGAYQILGGSTVRCERTSSGYSSVAGLIVQLATNTGEDLVEDIIITTIVGAVASVSGGTDNISANTDIGLNLAQVGIAVGGGTGQSSANDEDTQLLLIGDMLGGETAEIYPSGSFECNASIN